MIFCYILCTATLYLSMFFFLHVNDFLPMTYSKLRNPKFVKELNEDYLKIVLALKINRIDHCPQKKILRRGIRFISYFRFKILLIDLSFMIEFNSKVWTVLESSY